MYRNVRIVPVSQGPNILFVKEGSLNTSVSQAAHDGQKREGDWVTVQQGVAAPEDPTDSDLRCRGRDDDTFFPETGATSML